MFMAQTMVNIRMDADLKRDVEKVCSETELSMTTAFTLFAKKSSRERRIPFEIAGEMFKENAWQIFIMEILPFDGAAANAYGKICAYLQRQGTPIGTMDMLIAGHALTADRILVTDNVRGFDRVPSLRITASWSILLIKPPSFRDTFV